MRLKLSILVLLFCVTSCYSSIKETAGNYYLPTIVNHNPTKKGKACARTFPIISYFVSDYDITVEKARREAGIKEIISIETEKTYMPGYISKCTIVLGN